MDSATACQQVIDAMRVRHHLCLLLLSVTGVTGSSGCSEGRSRPGSDSAATTRSVTLTPEAAFRARLGTTWELARLGSQDMPPTPARPAPPTPGRHPAPGSRPTIRFTDDSVGALSSRPDLRSAGGWSFCNGYGTAYEL